MAVLPHAHRVNPPFTPITQRTHPVETPFMATTQQPINHKSEIKNQKYKTEAKKFKKEAKK